MENMMQMENHLMIDTLTTFFFFYINHLAMGKSPICRCFMMIYHNLPLKHGTFPAYLKHVETL